MQKFLKSAFVVSFATLLSRISGFIRDIFLAKYLGSGFFSDIFVMAFRIPNFFRKIFAEGAFNSAFIPIFASGVHAHGKTKMMMFARNLFSILLYFLLLFTFVVEISMPVLMHILAPGYVSNPEKFALVVLLTRITFPYLIFISIVSFICGILHSFGKFFAGSVVPVILNLTIIIFAILFRNFDKIGIVKGLSYGIFVAGIFQLLWILYFSVKNKIILYPVFPKISKTSKTFFSKFFHSFLSSGIMQISTMIDSIVATLVPGGVSLLYYGDRISQFPLSLIGTAIGVSILPLLSKSLSNKGNKEEAQKLQEDSIFLACFLGIPAAVGLFTLSSEIVEVLFQRGQFLAEDTLRVSIILKIYSIALPFFIFSKILQSIFYAKKDTKTPMQNSLNCLIINIFVSLSLVKFIGVNGIALATTFSAVFTTFSLFYKLLKKKIFEFSSNFQIRILKIIYTSMLMGIFIFSSRVFLSEFSVPTILKLLVSISIGGLTFFTIAHILKIFSLHEILSFLKKKNKK